MIAIVAAGLLAFSSAQLAPPPPFETFRTAGLVLAKVQVQGDPVFAAEGCARFAADGRTCERPMTADAMVRVASISKLATAIGVMRMVEAGRLDLDRDVSHYLGYWVHNPAFPKSAVTLRHLLTHTSSLTDGPGYVFGLGERIANSVNSPGRWDLEHSPGTHFRYANYNFVLIGTVMEAAANERFDRLMARLVLRPLDIDGCYNWTTCSNDLIERAATLYRTGKDESSFAPDGPWVAQVDDLRGVRPPCPVFRADPSIACELNSIRPGVNGGLFSPQGGLRITAAGLAKIAQMLMRDGRGPKGRFLSKGSVRALLTPGWRFAAGPANGQTDNGTMCAYGLSVHVIAAQSAAECRDDLFADGRWRAGHAGEAYGFYGGIWIDPRSKRASIYLITGTSRNPGEVPGQHSGFTALEERIAARVR